MKVIVVAPHPDDETIGCGGAMLRHAKDGDDVVWLIVTCVTPEAFGQERAVSRAAEIKAVAERLGVKKTIEMGFPTTTLDQVSDGDMIGVFSKVFSDEGPEVVYTPFAGDPHSDHRRVAEAVAACSKWFRYPSVKTVLAYEAISETDAALDVYGPRFAPNWFVDISSYVDEKVEIAKLYESEFHDFPFPRSARAVRALAEVRGAQAGYEAAEAFMLLRRRV